MITVRIAGEPRALADADPYWITQQVNRRRQEDLAVCLQVEIHEPSVRLTISSRDCGGGGGSFVPDRAQQEIIDLWHKHGLDTSDFDGGQVNAFVQQLKRMF